MRRWLVKLVVVLVLYGSLIACLLIVVEIPPDDCCVEPASPTPIVPAAESTVATPHRP